MSFEDLFALRTALTVRNPISGLRIGFDAITLPGFVEIDDMGFALAAQTPLGAALRAGYRIDLAEIGLTAEFEGYFGGESVSGLAALLYGIQFQSQIKVGEEWKFGLRAGFYDFSPLTGSIEFGAGYSTGSFNLIAALEWNANYQTAKLGVSIPITNIGSIQFGASYTLFYNGWGIFGGVQLNNLYLVRSISPSLTLSFAYQPGAGFSGGLGFVQEFDFNPTNQ